MKLSERQKKELIEKQDTHSLNELATLFRTTPEEVYESYSEMLDDGSYFKYYVKKVPAYEKRFKW